MKKIINPSMATNWTSQ